MLENQIGSKDRYFEKGQVIIDKGGGRVDHISDFDKDNIDEMINCIKEEGGTSDDYDFSAYVNENVHYFDINVEVTETFTGKRKEVFTFKDVTPLIKDDINVNSSTFIEELEKFASEPMNFIL